MMKGREWGGRQKRRTEWKGEKQNRGRWRKGVGGRERA